MLDEGNYDFDEDEDEIIECWDIDDDESEPDLNNTVNAVDINLGPSSNPSEEVDRKLAIQIQMELDRDPRAANYYRDAHNDGTVKAESLRDMVDSRMSTSHHKLAKITTPSITSLKLAPGPKFEHTSLVKSNKFLAGGWGNNEQFSDDDDDEYFDDEDVENIETERARKRSQRENKRKTRKLCKKQYTKLLLSTSTSAKGTADQGTQWTKRFDLAETSTYPANSTEEEHLLYGKGIFLLNMYFALLTNFSFTQNRRT